MPSLSEIQDIDKLYPELNLKMEQEFDSEEALQNNDHGELEQNPEHDQTQ
jgi:hypothetical protein